MNNFINILTKGLASITFVALLAVNVQVGNGSMTSDSVGVQNAKAGNCPVGTTKCSVYVFPNGKKYWEYGEVIVVTPEEN